MEQVVLEYEPNYWQDLIRKNLTQKNVLVCHRGLGKTTMALPLLVEDVLTSEVPRAEGLYIAPLRDQAKKLAWMKLLMLVEGIPGVNKNENDLRVDLPPDKTIWLLGADNPDSIRGHHPVSVACDEVGQMRPSIWTEVLLPASWRHNARMTFIGTPKGRNLFHTLHESALEETKAGNPDWFDIVVKASESGLVPAKALQEAKKHMGEDMYAQEYECSFLAAVAGAYLSDILNTLDTGGFLGDFPYDPLCPVYTGWDLGLGENLCVWFVQHVGSRWRLIDFHMNPPREGAEYAARVVMNKPYAYKYHYLPWDAARGEQGSGKTQKELLETILGPKIEVVTRMAVDDAINAARLLLHKAAFNRPTCSEAFETLKHYQREWVEKNGVFRAAPLDNFARDTADAFRTLAVGLQETSHKKRQVQATGTFDEFGDLNPLASSYESDYDELNSGG